MKHDLNYPFKNTITLVRHRLKTFDPKQFRKEVKELLRFHPDPHNTAKIIMWIVAAFLTAITLGGVLIGYVRGYNKFMYPKKEEPRLYHLPNIVIFSMVAGSVLVWLFLWLAIKILIGIVGPELMQSRAFYMFIGVNLLLSIPVYWLFSRWQQRTSNYLDRAKMHGSAEVASMDVIEAYTGKPGLYIGAGMTYDSKGNIITVAGCRSGKGVNLLVANLLYVGRFSGSFVVTDPKGELAAICANALRSMGKNVVILNPWQILPQLIAGTNSYNPMDFLSDKSSVHLVDDVKLIAEMICPIKHDDHNAFFTSSARNIIAALLLLIAVTQEGENRSLGTLWEWCRKSGDDWDNMLADMAVNDDPVNGLILRNAASAIASSMTSKETFSSIMANVFECTDFLNSPALRENLKSGFDPYSLTDGNTVVFVVIPSDKLTSYGAFLRLTVTTLMRSIIRKPNPKTRTVFMIDEAYALGYISEIPIGLASYPGYGITMWLVYQDLNQIQMTYGQGWQTVMANSSVKMMFGVRDQFTADYVSQMAGDTTNVFYNTDNGATGKSGAETNVRRLFTPDEVRRKSDGYMFTFIDQHPVAVVPKFPYYKMAALKNPDGTNIYSPNPYIDGSL